MELKHVSKFRLEMVKQLLIVPYGIETTLRRREILIQTRLLIVPYGIET